MKARFLGSNELTLELPRLIDSCDELLIAIAYVKHKGLNTILPRINSLIERKGALKIVFGLSHDYGITDKESVEELYKLSRKGLAEIRKYNNSGFHPKLFIFKGDSTSILIGSSNITAQAQSTNSEANVLIENPDMPFFEQVTQFFNEQFLNAPKLKRSDIDNYNPLKSKAFKSQRKRKVPLDQLPTPEKSIREIGEIKPNNIWKIAPGQDAEYWSEWLSQIDEQGRGIVAVGWDVGDLSHFSSKEELKVKVRSNWENDGDGKRNVGYITNQLWTLANEIKKGDILIVYSECSIQGIAVVQEENPYRYKLIKSLNYENQLQVKYHYYQLRPNRADQKIVDALGKRGTIKPIENKKIWEYIKNQYFINLNT